MSCRTASRRSLLIRPAAFSVILWCALMLNAAAVVPSELPEALIIIGAVAAAYATMVFQSQRVAIAAALAEQARIDAELHADNDVQPFVLPSCVPVASRAFPSTQQKD